MLKNTNTISFIFIFLGFLFFWNLWFFPFGINLTGNAFFLGNFNYHLSVIIPYSAIGIVLISIGLLLRKLLNKQNLLTKQGKEIIFFSLSFLLLILILGIYSGTKFIASELVVFNWIIAFLIIFLGKINYPESFKKYFWISSLAGFLLDYLFICMKKIY